MVDMDNICVIQYDEEDEKEEEWIECTSCERWMHWICSGRTRDEVVNIRESFFTFHLSKMLDDVTAIVSHNTVHL